MVIERFEASLDVAQRRFGIFGIDIDLIDDEGVQSFRSTYVPDLEELAGGELGRGIGSEVYQRVEADVSSD